MQSNIINNYLSKFGFKDYKADEGRLMLLELIVKAGAGYYNSHTEEGFLLSFGCMKKDRTPNKRGREFIMSMVYEGSNRRPRAYSAMTKYRN